MNNVKKNSEWNINGEKKQGNKEKKANNNVRGRQYRVKNKPLIRKIQVKFQDVEKTKKTEREREQTEERERNERELAERERERKSQGCRGKKFIHCEETQIQCV